MAKKRDEWDREQEQQSLPQPESSFADMPQSGQEQQAQEAGGAFTPPEDLPPPEGKAESGRATSLARTGNPASTDRPGEEDPARFPSSRGVPPRPEHRIERPATGDDSSGPPRPPLADPSLPLPRVCDQGERAYPGSTRYKVRADIPGEPRAPLYILAPEGDVQAAKDCYAKAHALDKRRRVVDEEGKVKEVQQPYDLVIVALPD